MLDDLRGEGVAVAAMALWSRDAIPLPCLRSSDAPSGLASFRIEADLTVHAARSGQPVPEGLGTTAVLHVSSGSTGRPKVVRRGIASVLMEADGYQDGLSLSQEDRLLVPIPLAHSLGWGTAMSGLLSGCAVDAQPMVRPSAVARKIDSGAATVVALTPLAARLLAGTTRHPGGRVLRCAFVGAGAVSDQLDEEFGARFGVQLTRGYGASETGGTFIGNRGIGRPVSGVKVVHPLPGHSGELQLQLDAPVEGYLDSTEPPSCTWHTGDLVHHDADGVVRFLERLRPAIRLNDRFIDAYHLERVLRGVNGVEAVHLLTTASPDRPEVERLYAVVAGVDPNAAELEACLASLPDDVPIPRIIRCDSLPSDAVGKPDRQKIIALVRAGDA
ncbi:AMP-binding protein [Micromonospora sp. NBC_00421]|uniref:AMP-binding protein n=1 Tax=Micromonospora sp. NBC_00421 TaxID=2975976 RepID=UPI002E1B9D49